ncbi:MAG: Bax inhibitor-1 family protein [bacterium]|nr:Bax inhibitor-1 family protein [bacterium]
MLKTDVYDRHGVGDLTRNTFYLVMGCVLAWGFTATHIVSQMTADWRPGTLMVLLVGLGLPILGILMSASESAFVSFLGFNLVVIPFGAILGPVLAAYELAQPGIVAEAAMLTAMVTGVMALSGLLFPDFYRSIGGALFSALVALLVVRIASLFIPALADFNAINYLAAGLFALYIGYDMWRASEIPATVDNAVDVAISLYLDIINLFMNILRILGHSKR